MECWFFGAKFWPEKITSRDGCLLPDKGGGLSLRWVAFMKGFGSFGSPREHLAFLWMSCKIQDEEATVTGLTLLVVAAVLAVSVIGESFETPTPTCKAKISTKLWPLNYRVCLVLKHLGHIMSRLLFIVLPCMRGGRGSLAHF